MEINLLYLGAVVFGLLLVGVGFTVIEFRTKVDPPQ
jgi:hypothetical protein